jgi:hypothetical protein
MWRLSVTHTELWPPIVQRLDRVEQETARAMLPQKSGCCLVDSGGVSPSAFRTSFYFISCTVAYESTQLLANPCLMSKSLAGVMQMC